MNHNITILYVEDEEDIRNELSEILALDFGKVVLAGNGEEGLKLFKQENPHLIISDIQMPKMDGLKMCEEIRSINSTVPIILTTAFTEQGYMQEAKKLMIPYFIGKPINVMELYECIEKIFANTKDD